MKIEEPSTVSQAKQRISIDEPIDELSLFSELSDEEMLQIAGGGSLEDIVKQLAPVILPLVA